MRHLIIIVLIFNFLIGIAQTPVTDSTFAILEFDTSGYCSSKFYDYYNTEFNQNDLPIIDSILQDFIIKKTNPNKPFQCGLEIHDYQYYYQFVALKNNKGEDIVWVNAFLPSILQYTNTATRKEKRRLKKGKSSTFLPFDWHKHLVCGNDGCGAFWELKININTRTIFDAYISGI